MTGTSTTNVLYMLPTDLQIARLSFRLRALARTLEALDAAQASGKAVPGLEALVRDATRVRNRIKVEAMQLSHQAYVREVTAMVRSRQRAARLARS